MKKKESTEKKPIPVFFAADENYMPYLGVTLTSLKANKRQENRYEIYVLYAGELSENAMKIKRMEEKDFSVTFVDITKKIEEITHLIRCRDYYTSAIYYRLFIPELFPQYDKAVYLDCDTVLLEDVAVLYGTELGENLIAAVPDQAVAAVVSFREYTQYALGISYEKYFNSGVIVMNLEKMRALNFYVAFSKILSSYDFIVAPDQDCLNLICKGNVRYLDAGWNAMPTGDKLPEKRLKLIHYNLSAKPWHYDDIVYGEYFWTYAKTSGFYKQIAANRAAFTEDLARRDERNGERLLALAQAEADSPCNYLRTRTEKGQERANEGGRYGFIEGFTRTPSGIKAD